MEMFSDEQLYGAFSKRVENFSETSFKQFLDYTFDPEKPDDLNNESLSSFVTRNIANGRRLVVLTSGGTIAPLEDSMVRFIDNFSTGTRGALSAQYFLQSPVEYDIVFIHRKGSKLPFLHNVDVLRYANTYSKEDGDGIQSTDSMILNHLQNWKKYRNRIFLIQYITIKDYLVTLRAISGIISSAGSKAFTYLAAAVSDFYVPPKSLPEHKIRSRTGDLVLRLSKTPKLLGTICQKWMTQAFTVSFKLETDAGLLSNEMKRALEIYKVSAVVGNILHKRYEEVVVMCVEGSTVIRRSDDGMHIEESLITDLIERHSCYLQTQSMG